MQTPPPVQKLDSLFGCRRLTINHGLFAALLVNRHGTGPNLPILAHMGIGHRPRPFVIVARRCDRPLARHILVELGARVRGRRTAIRSRGGAAARYAHAVRIGRAGPIGASGHVPSRRRRRLGRRAVGLRGYAACASQTGRCQGYRYCSLHLSFLSGRSSMMIRHPSGPRVTVMDRPDPSAELDALDDDPDAPADEEDALTCDDACLPCAALDAAEAPWPSSAMTEISTRPSAKIWVRWQVPLAD